MKHEWPIWVCFAVVGGLAAINVLALVLYIIAIGRLYDLSCVAYAPIPTVLACGGLLLAWRSVIEFNIAIAASACVCVLSAIGIFDACGNLFGWQYSELGEGAVWMWLLQIPFATFAALAGCASQLFRRALDEPAS